jgi:hypothetical protein
LPNPFCLFSILLTSGTHVRQAESDQLNENSIFDMGTLAAVQGAAVVSDDIHLNGLNYSYARIYLSAHF